MECKMLFVFGVAITAFGCGGFWYLLPRQGVVHPFVQKWDGGQLVTIGIMSIITCGIALMLDGLFG
jgi:hypothetical protein